MFRRSVPPRRTSAEPALPGAAVALAAAKVDVPAKLDATSKQAPIAAMATESDSFLCIRLLPSIFGAAPRFDGPPFNHRLIRRRGGDLVSWNVSKRSLVLC